MNPTGGLRIHTSFCNGVSERKRQSRVEKENENWASKSVVVRRANQSNKADLFRQKVEEYNLFELSLEGEKFALLSPEIRFAMLDDLFEFDACYFSNNFKISFAKEKQESKGMFTKFTNKFFKPADSKAWQGLQAEALLKKNGCSVLRAKISENLGSKGIPHVFRPAIWKFLIGNQLRINKALFGHLIKGAVASYLPDSIIQKDIDRTFSYFSRSREFSQLLIEATYLLQSFALYRPDLKYIQGMSYLMVMLLIVYPPYKAFKMFCNLVVCKKILFDNYSFKKEANKRINRTIEDIVQRSAPKTYKFLKHSKVEMWTMLWVEWLYAMFLRTFDLKTCFVLWDFMLAKSELFIFKLNNVVFKLIEENFDSLVKGNFFEGCKFLILSSPEHILKEIAVASDHEFDINFADKNIQNSVVLFS